MHPTRSLALVMRIAPLVLAGAFAGCGPVSVATESAVPVPLVDPMPITVGVYYSEDFSKAQHSEERWGTDWKVDLGPYHVRMAEKLFASEFRETMRVEDIKSLPANPPYRAIIEPRIEQYSFITPRDTGAKYFAVTIRYRLNVYAPNGVLADSLTFTGYGSNASGSGITSTGPMVLATKAAMRDAAAKFLVQFPEQDIAKKLLTNDPLTEAPQVAVQSGQGPTAPTSTSPTAAGGSIESVPILDPTAESAPTATTPATTTPPATTPPGTTAPDTNPPASTPSATGAEGAQPSATPPEKSEPAPADGDSPPATPAPESPKISPQTNQPTRQGSA
jgi:hypothetical protein